MFSSRRAMFWSMTLRAISKESLFEAFVLSEEETVGYQFRFFKVVKKILP